VANGPTNASADVGTGGKYDVPSLLGWGAALRNLHDGSAPRSRRGSRWAQGDAHGNVSQLDARERPISSRYLETL